MLTCDDCERTGPDVFETECPYARDIEGVEEKCTLCADCLDARAEEI